MTFFGHQDFPEIDAEVQRISHVTGGAEFLGSPIFGSDTFFADSVAKRVKVLSCQEHLDIKYPQVELHLLCSCLGLCKINHILRTVYHLIESTGNCTSLILVCAITWNCYRYPNRSFLIVLGGK